VAVVIQSPNEKFVMAEQWVQRPLKKGERYGFSVWLKADRPRGEVTLLEHVKAALGVAVGVAFVVLYTTGMYREANPRVHKLMLGFVIFYFGSR